MKKLLDFDWLRVVQFKCNTSAKSVTLVQITKKSKLFKTNQKPNQEPLWIKKKEERIREKRKNILDHTSTRGLKRRETCCRVSLFTLAKLFKPLDLEKTNKLKISSNNWPWNMVDALCNLENIPKHCLKQIGTERSHNDCCRNLTHWHLRIFTFLSDFLHSHAP